MSKHERNAKLKSWRAAAPKKPYLKWSFERETFFETRASARRKDGTQNTLGCLPLQSQDLLKGNAVAVELA